MMEQATKKCIYCAEDILAGAIVCKHCGRDLVAQPQQPPSPSTTIIMRQKDPGCLIQVLWFFFIGAWLGQLWIAGAWCLNITIIGMPLGVMMLNRLPKIIALRGSNEDTILVTTATGTVTAPQVPQRHIVVRALYFLLIGGWASLLWVQFAYFLCMTIIGMPLGFWMFERTPVIVSLHRSASDTVVVRHDQPRSVARATSPPPRLEERIKPQAKRPQVTAQAREEKLRRADEPASLPIGERLSMFVEMMNTDDEVRSQVAIVASLLIAGVGFCCITVAVASL